MSVLAGSLFLVAVVFVIPGAAIVGAVYAQYLMETRPPRGARRVRSAERAGEACSDVVAARA